MTAAARHRTDRARSAVEEQVAIRRTDQAMTRLETVLARSAALARDLLDRTDPKDTNDG